MENIGYHTEAIYREANISISALSSKNKPLILPGGGILPEGTPPLL